MMSRPVCEVCQTRPSEGTLTVVVDTTRIGFARCLFICALCGDMRLQVTVTDGTVKVKPLGSPPQCDAVGDSSNGGSSNAR